MSPRWVPTKQVVNVIPHDPELSSERGNGAETIKIRAATETRDRFACCWEAMGKSNHIAL